MRWVVWDAVQLSRAHHLEQDAEDVGIETAACHLENSLTLGGGVHAYPPKRLSAQDLAFAPQMTPGTLQTQHGWPTHQHARPHTP